MTDDIVTRLRAEANDAFTKAWHTGNGQVCEDAVDEIERLREEVNLWMGVAERFAESHPHFEAFRYYFKARLQ